MHAAPSAPAEGAAVHGAARAARRLARAFLRVTGWEFEGERPAAPSFVMVGAPHTSNWDLAYFLAFMHVLGLRARFMAKHTLFRGPLGPLFRALGGIAIQRHVRGNVTQQMVAEFRADPQLVLAVPAEGTRRYVSHWRSGFYHIARGANVPVVPGFLDYVRRRGGLGPPIWLSGDVRADMDRLRAFFADKRPHARHPELAGEIRLCEENRTPA
jgi:1-acyl-sn-glycerol-3-phosphate acyltransferase